MDTQLLLFEQPKNEFNGLWEALEELKTSHNKVRKRLFAEVGELKKEMITVKAENQRLKFHTEMKPCIRWVA